MLYNIHFNMRKIAKIDKPFKLHQSNVLTYVDIDPELLREKDTWYYLNGKVSFFKPRSDVRVAAECISEAYAEALGFRAAKYSVVKLDEQIGLVSENFQDIRKYRYYDFCQLHQIFSSFPRRYNCFTMKQLLQTVEYHYPNDYEELQQSIIDRYVFDWFTHQLDGNPRNTNLRQCKKTGKLEVDHVFDKEQSFGVSAGGRFDEKKLRIWLPAIPYEEIGFRENPYQIDGLDANMLSLLIDYPEMTVHALKRIFSIDYRSILDTFTSGENAFSLPTDTLSYLKGIIEMKENEKNKLLKLV